MFCSSCSDSGVRHSNTQPCPKCQLPMNLEYTSYSDEDGTWPSISGISTPQGTIPYSVYTGNHNDHFSCPKCGTVLRPNFEYTQIGKEKLCGLIGSDTYIPNLVSFWIVDLDQEFRMRNPNYAMAEELKSIKGILRQRYSNSSPPVTTAVTIV